MGVMDALPTSGRCQVADISDPSGRTNEDEDNVLAVLLCGDIHAAIGARPGLSQLELWRRFVQTSLLVHPGANAHPACAWNVLNSNFTCGACSAQADPSFDSAVAAPLRDGTDSPETSRSAVGGESLTL